MNQTLNDIVLVPTDFSETYQNAINHGVELAESMDYKLVILHVINLVSRSQLKQENIDISSITEHLDDIANDIRENTRITVETLVREGSIFDEIQQVSSEIGAKIVVLLNNSINIDDAEKYKNLGHQIVFYGTDEKAEHNQ